MEFDESLLREYCEETEDEFQMNGLYAGIYWSFIVEVVKKYITKKN